MILQKRYDVQGPGGSGFIVPSSESGPSDQTDIDRVVFLKVLGRWSIVPKLESVWSRGEGGRPVREGGRPVPGSVTSPVRSRGFWSLLDGR